MYTKFQTILDRAWKAISEQTPEAWAAFTKTDGVHLAEYAKRLRAQVRALNDGTLDLCPECCCEYWVRPQLHTPGEAQEWPHDDTRRRCKDCGAIRPEPPG